MARMSGKTAVITGGARGQGRSHAVRLAEEGANIVISDLLKPIDEVPYPLATREDLEETIALVEKTGQRCIGVEADVRSASDMERVADVAVSEFGRIDVLAANAGVATVAAWNEFDEKVFDETMNVNVKGVWLSVRAVVPSMIENGGGSIIVTSSAIGMRGAYNQMSYGPSKHAVIGMTRNLAAELAPHRIRVNVVLPGIIDTPMMTNDTILNLFAGMESGAKVEDIWDACESLTLLPQRLHDPVDVSNAVLFLASDESKSITAVALPVDSGQVNQPSGIPPSVMKRLAEAEYRSSGR